MTKLSEKSPGFKVVIVGGGIAGLTLANSLERAGIDYILHERRGEIAPQVGASIGLLPNGCRILDQLGVYDEIKSNMTPPKGDVVWADNGRKVTESHAADLLNAR
jgi:2-polyprenyl-6-methoxyphenol hydroxylase-like FAD-dependent oxidoreductase